MESIPPEVMIDAYASGWFPMADPAGDLEWYRPDPRGVLPLDGLRVPSSLKRRIRNAPFQIRCDTAFDDVVAHCAAPTAGRMDTWIDDRIASTFSRLHRAGMAHSIEAWAGDRLVGGLYGLHLRGAFMGESMFCAPERGGTDASKVCLAWLVGHLRGCGCSLLDVQFNTPHLERLGVQEVSAATYEGLLAAALEQPRTWGPLPPDAAAVLKAIS